MSKRKILPALGLVVASVFSLAGCVSEETGNTVKDAIKEAEGMTYEELVNKAKVEIGENKLEVFGNSSALEKALTNFTQATGIKTGNNKMGDAALYEKLTYTIGMDKYSADMVLLQDGNKLQTSMLNPGYLYNYTPKDYKEVLAKDDLEPTGAVYLNKVFMYNNTDFNGSNADTAKAGQLKNYLTNVWQLAGKSTDAKHISGVSFKPGSTENINMNFLIMLTSEEWCTKLASAYKSFYGKDYVAEKEYKNIGYKWIAEFLANTTNHSSDGTACKDTAKGTGGTMVYCNFNKLKDCKEQGVGKQDKANLTTSVIEQDAKVEGFGGFIYKMYTMIPKNAKYPFAACALVNYILSTEGYGAAWGANLGYYSTNPNNKLADGDKELSWWKKNCVIEDPKYVASEYLEAYDFITTLEAKKN